MSAVQAREQNFESVGADEVPLRSVGDVVGAHRPRGRRPVIVLVSADPSVLETLERDLSHGFRSAAEVVSLAGASEGLDELRALLESPAPVALLVIDERMPGMSGIEFMAEAHALHPLAKRMLLVER